MTEGRCPICFDTSMRKPQTGTTETSINRTHNASTATTSDRPATSYNVCYVALLVGACCGLWFVVSCAAIMGYRLYGRLCGNYRGACWLRVFARDCVIRYELR